MSDATILQISPREASELLANPNGNYLLLDVRTDGEFAHLHATGATSLPLHTMSRESMQLLNGKKIICICQKGRRGEQAATTLIQNGFGPVYNIVGGTEAWEHDGLSVQRGKQAVSLERQVRIVAGLLVVIGIAAGNFVSPYFLYLSLFVGCGLVFAGVTDTCAMGSLLARCPWNSKT